MSNPNPNLPPSDEVSAHQFSEALLAEDWDKRFSEKAAEMRAAKAQLDEAQDPDEIITATERKGRALIRGLGSGAISLFKRDVLAEREQFEAEFGQQDEI